MHNIRFGTSGWRGIFGEDFIFDNVRVVTQAIADYLRFRKLQERGLVIGHDSRFLGKNLPARRLASWLEMVFRHFSAIGIRQRRSLLMKFCDAERPGPSILPPATIRPSTTA